jgi:hypothetical protein
MTEFIRGAWMAERTIPVPAARKTSSNAAGAVLDHRKDVHLGAVEEAGGKEVQGQDPLRLRPQELGPPWTVAARRRIDPGVLEDLPDRGRRHGDAQSRELAVDPR